MRYVKCYILWKFYYCMLYYCMLYIAYISSVEIWTLDCLVKHFVIVNL